MNGSATLKTTTAAPAYPEGWFHVVYSDEIAPGDVKPLEYFGEKLVAFRTQDGVVQVLDAFCAHLGAHLGIGGTVVGEHLRCPFHAWEYGVDGACKRIAYSDRIPKTAVVRAWPTVERSGLVMVWYSPAGNPPFWDAPELPEYGDPAWTDYVVRHRYTIHTTAQEIVENIPDTAHFQFVHGNAGGAKPPESEFSFEKHRMHTEIRHDLPAYGGVNRHTVTVHGLGLALNWSRGRGTKCFWTTYTPIDRDTLDVRFAMIAARSVENDPTGEASLASTEVTLREFEKDIPIWEHKTYRANPLISPDDGPIARFRSWIRQFYPEPA